MPARSNSCLALLLAIGNEPGKPFFFFFDHLSVWLVMILFDLPLSFPTLSFSIITNLADLVCLVHRLSSLVERLQHTTTCLQNRNDLFLFFLLFVSTISFDSSDEHMAH
jgi:dipeptide/tripeptide permease